MNYFKTFLLFLIVGLFCSAAPFGVAGIILGSPAVIINSIILTLLLHKGLLK
jgi:hypothetical protein